MSYALANDLRAIGRRLEEGQVKLAARFDDKKNVFLSHSHLDGDLVKGVFRVLRRHGATPYVDWDDDALEGLGNLDRAVVLRTQIESCGRLVMLMSDEGAKSGWMPWELGLADGLHSRARAVTFPVLEGSQPGEVGRGGNTSLRTRASNRARRLLDQQVRSTLSSTPKTESIGSSAHG